MRHRVACLLVVLLLAGVIAHPTPARPATAQYTELSIVAQWSSRVERADFEALLLPFIAQASVQPDLIAAADIQQTLARQLEAGTPPDIALLSWPGLLPGYADHLVDLGTALGPPPDGYPADLAASLTVDGTEYGRLVRLTAKGLVWYHPLNLINAGYERPTTWDELVTLTEAMRQDRRQPWALGLTTGDPGTDIIEALLLQRHGPAILDDLLAGDVAWTDPRVVTAWTDFGAILAASVIGDPPDAAQAVFATPPGAYFNAGPSTALAWALDAQPDLEPEQQIAFFLLPAGDARQVAVGADFIVLFNDDPLTRELAAYLTAPETTAAWAATGSAIAPYPDVVYPNAVLDAAAELARDAPAFDLSDRLPPAQRAAFLAGIRRYMTDPDTLDEILQAIETG
jgi:alpha-glucoside transport system substrate-binding protein